MLHPNVSRSGWCKYDKTGDNHYDTISAFIKSMRGSDPDAAVYYLAKMLYAGEDVKFIARRIMICASEDVGNADPMALTVAVSRQHRRWSGSECRRHRSFYHRRLLMWQAHQRAIRQLMRFRRCDGQLCGNTRRTGSGHICRMPITKASAKLGHGIGYKYAHDYPNHYVKQQYLPDGLTDTNVLSAVGERL